MERRPGDRAVGCGETITIILWSLMFVYLAGVAWVLFVLWVETGTYHRAAWGWPGELAKMIAVQILGGL